MNESKNIKCCQLLDTMKGTNGMFADKLREEKYMNEIIRYNLAVLTQLEIMGCLCKTCLEYKKEYLEPVLPKFKEILDQKRYGRTN
ncbi:MAG: hypothetical protein I3274_05875 [Candidatus Moeniiplasma glomeromycotorum]|nr:hypothetical protein [Candidatus Moeniiplasma glomeromycotorum]